MSIANLKTYVGGDRIQPGTRDHLDVENSTLSQTICWVLLSSAEQIDKTVVAAKAAFPEWSATPVFRHCELFLKLVERIRVDAEKLARLISQENGKSLPDFRAEVKRVLKNAEVVCGRPVLLQGDKLIDGAVAKCCVCPRKCLA